MVGFVIEIHSLLTADYYCGRTSIQGKLLPDETYIEVPLKLGYYWARLILRLSFY